MSLAKLSWPKTRRPRPGRRLFGALALAAAALASAPAHAADDVPACARGVRIVVPFGPGGAADAMARRLADGLGERWKQQVLVDNRPGGGGAIGVQALRGAPADGCTLMLAANGILQNMAARPAAPDPLTQLLPVAMVARSPAVVAVPGSSPVKTIDELIAHLRAQGASASYASTGHGSSAHLYAEDLKRRYRLLANHVPYQGDAKPGLDLAAGRVDFFITAPSGLAGLRRQGSLRFVAVTGVGRLPQLPGVPTLKESGIDGFDEVGWYGVFLPPGTPQRTIDGARSAVAQVVATTGFAELLDKGLLMSPAPGDFESQIRAGLRRAKALMTDNGVQPE